MERGKVTYLSYITAIDNVASIIERGILCHNRAEQVPHVSIADAEVQARRAAVILPSGRHLHDYANLYFWARNAMMYRRRDERICVICVSTNVLDIPGTYYSTRNAAAANAEFHECVADFTHLDESKLYRKSWSSNGTTDEDLMQCMQAEVLVPAAIDSGLIEWVYARSKNDMQALAQLAPDLDRRLHPGIFFDS